MLVLEPRFPHALNGKAFGFLFAKPGRFRSGLLERLIPFRQHQILLQQFFKLFRPTPPAPTAEKLEHFGQFVG